MAPFLVWLPQQEESKPPQPGLGTCGHSDWNAPYQDFHLATMQVFCSREAASEVHSHPTFPLPMSWCPFSSFRTGLSKQNGVTSAVLASEAQPLRYLGAVTGCYCRIRGQSLANHQAQDGVR
jgi:hypothetical protein